MLGCFKFKQARLTTDFMTHDNILSLVIDKSSNIAIKQMLEVLNDSEIYLAEIKKPKRKRTLDQNAYLWVLCDRIAKIIGSTKEEVYRRFIKARGVSDILCIQNKALDRFIANWSNKGVGWFCETDTSKIDGCTNVIAYYGTSVYSTNEMKQVLDEVLDECKNLNISTVVDGYNEE